MSGLEILGAVASSIALAQAVQGTIKAVNLLREIRQIRQQCDDLKNEIDTIDGFILEATRLTGLPLRPQPPPEMTQEHPTVSRTIQELQGIQEALNQIVAKYSNDRKWHDPRRIARKMQWLSESKKIEELARKAQNTKLNLHFAITLRTSSILHSIKQHTIYYLEGSQQNQTGLLKGPLPGPVQASVLGPVEGRVEEIETEGDSCLETSEASVQSMADSLQLDEFQSLLLADESGGCTIAILEGALESIEILLELWKNVLPQQGLSRKIGYYVNYILVHCSWLATDDRTRHVLTKVLSFTQGGRRVRIIHQAAKQGDTVQMWQALREQPEAIDELDSCGRAPIHYAVFYNNIDMLEQLILAGANTIRRDFGGYTPLMVATSNGHEEAAQILLQNDRCRRHIDIQGNSGKTALHWAVKEASLECVHMLLEAGATVEKRDFVGWTPLHDLALSQADQQTAHLIIRLLQGQHARLDAQDNRGMTTLLQAVANNNAPVLHALVDAGASLNIISPFFGNILHLAAVCADLEMMSYLAEQHITLVDPGLRDFGGFTPLGRLGWCWQVEDWQLYEARRRPGPEEQQMFISLSFDLLSHYLLRHMSTLKQLLRAAEQRDTSTSSERITALIQKSNVIGRGDMVKWYRGIQGNLRDGNWEQVVLDVQDEYDEAYEDLGRAGVARNKTLADPEVRAFF
ncbi:hypothetical protein CEP53_000763 [Fusarium sp. AF-6]|nr:hypothetical protein CEP53_000763 [Fusarium sp. AF-6]